MRYARWLLLVTVLVALPASVAMAQRRASRSERVAISAGVNRFLGKQVPKSCLTLRIASPRTTGWSLVVINGRGQGCRKYGLAGGAFFHRQRGRWTYVNSVRSLSHACHVRRVPHTVTRRLGLCR